MTSDTCISTIGDPATERIQNSLFVRRVVPCIHKFCNPFILPSTGNGTPITHGYSRNILSFFVGSVRDILKPVPFKYLNDSFPALSYASAREIPTFYIPPSWKRYPFRAEPHRIDHCREFPTPLPPYTTLLVFLVFTKVVTLTRCPKWHFTGC